MNYYNEFDPKTAAWLRELIKRNFIPAGDVDVRDIREVQASDVKGYTQCHFFAGIGGWSKALELAGWPATRPVWTGSCPCQPFSVAGAGKAQEDSRHLWPEMFRLIRECKPSVVFGEQVEGAVKHGWLDGICADLEAEGYAVGAHVLGAHSVGAPHIRQRMYWVADTQSSKRWTEQQVEREAHGGNGSGSGDAGGMADAQCPERRPVLRGHEFDRDDAGRDEATGRVGARGQDGGMADTNGGVAGDRRIQSGWEYRQQSENRLFSPVVTNESSFSERLADAARGRLGIDGGAQRQAGHADKRGENIRMGNAFDLIPCTDGKARRVESGTFPLAHGVPARVVRLRGYGNAIVPQVACEFIKAFCEIEQTNDCEF